MGDIDAGATGAACTGQGDGDGAGMGANGTGATGEGSGFIQLLGADGGSGKTGGGVGGREPPV